MLSSMTVENEHETTKLTTDLTLAKTQVLLLLLSSHSLGGELIESLLRFI